MCDAGCCTSILLDGRVEEPGRTRVAQALPVDGILDEMPKRPLGFSPLVPGQLPSLRRSHPILRFKLERSQDVGMPPEKPLWRACPLRKSNPRDRQVGRRRAAQPVQ